MKKTYYQHNRTNHCKIKTIEQLNSDSLFKIDSIWKINKYALKIAQL